MICSGFKFRHRHGEGDVFAVLGDFLLVKYQTMTVTTPTATPPPPWKDVLQLVPLADAYRDQWAFLAPDTDAGE